VAAALVIILLLDVFLRLVKHVWTEASSESFDIRVSGHLFSRLLRTRASDMPSSALATSMFREFEAVRDMKSSMATTLWVDGISIIILLGAIAMISGWLAVVPAMGLLSILIAWSVQAKIEKLSLMSRETQVARQSLLSEAVYGMEDVKLSGAGDRMAERMRGLTEIASRDGGEIRRLSNLSGTAVQAIANFVQYAIIIVGALMTINGYITMGTMIAASVLSGRVMAPCTALAGIAMRAGRARSAMRTISQLSSGREESMAGISPDPKTIEGRVTFSALTYHYPGREDPVLRGLDLIVEPGQVMILAGPRGGGKSTLGRLLTGLAVPDGEKDAGSVSIDGIAVSQYSPEGLRAIVGGCPQDCTLFSMSILENIRLARPTASDADIIKASQLAGAHEWIIRMPGGYSAQIIEGGRNISGGERQSLGLARTLLMDPKIVFLDEPTAHFDPLATKRFIDGMREWLKGRTAIISTHKPDLLTLAHRVAIVGGGRVVRVADPSEVMASMMAIRQQVAK
jgi:ATP-binding cassette subfamily C protein LapB